MKHNRKFLLVALVLMLASLLAVGIAMADEITGVKLEVVGAPFKLENTPYKAFDISTTATSGIKLTVEPATADVGTLVWSVDNPDYAALDYGSTGFDGTIWEANTLYSQKPGKAKVTVKVRNSTGQFIGVSASAEVEFVDVPLTKITFTQDTAETKIGTPIYLKADYLKGVEPANATYGENYLVWQVDDATLATVNNSGKLTPKKAGTVKVTAKGKTGDASATITVTITETPITGLKFDPTTLKVAVGDNPYLTGYLTIEPSSASIYDCKWVSSDISIVSVDYDGQIHAKKAGTVDITVTAKKYPDVKATMTVTVVGVPATGVAFTQANYDMYLESGSLDLGSLFEVTPIDATPIGYTFSSSDTEVATVDKTSGYVYAHKEGTTTITVSVRNDKDTAPITGTCTVTVKKIAITSLAFTKEAYTIKKNVVDSLNLYSRLIIKPDDVNWVGYYVDHPDMLIWDSSDYMVATVNQDGTVYPQAAGTATITVFWENDPTITASATVTVETIPISKVVMNKTTLEIADDDENTTSVYLKAKVYPQNAEIMEVYWTTSNPDVVTIYDTDDPSITAGGGMSPWWVKLDPRNNGTATITVHVNDGKSDFEASCEVTVNNRKAASIILAEEAYEDTECKKLTVPLFKDKNANKNVAQLYALNTQNYAPFDAGEVKWTSSATKIATVNRRGQITAKKAGKTVITAELADGRKASCTVTVAKNLIKKITGQKTITMRVGEYLGGYVDCSDSNDLYKYLTFTGTVKAFGTNRYKLYCWKLKFSSSNEEVATVDENGHVFANKEGFTTITMKATDGSKKKYTLKIIVIPARQ